MVTTLICFCFISLNLVQPFFIDHKILDRFSFKNATKYWYSYVRLFINSTLDDKIFQLKTPFITVLKHLLSKSLVFTTEKDMIGGVIHWEKEIWDLDDL